jgi:hypothetical protein
MVMVMILQVGLQMCVAPDFWLLHSLQASRGDTQHLVEKILNNLKVPAQDSISDVGVVESEGPIEYWPFRPQDYTDPWAGYNYALALKSGWKEEDILGCVQKLGRHSRLTFAGGERPFQIMPKVADSLLWKMSRFRACELVQLGSFSANSRDSLPITLVLSLKQITM